MLAYKGELEKTVTQDKARQHPDNVNAGLLTYPVLQTADIILHRAIYVPVGKGPGTTPGNGPEFCTAFQSPLR